MDTRNNLATAYASLQDYKQQITEHPEMIADEDEFMLEDIRDISEFLIQMYFE